MNPFQRVIYWNALQVFRKNRLDFYEDCFDAEVEPKEYIKFLMDQQEGRRSSTLPITERIYKVLQTGAPVWEALSEFMPSADIALLSAWESRGNWREGMRELIVGIREEDELKQQARKELVGPLFYLVIAIALMTYGVPLLVNSMGPALLNPAIMTLDQRLLVLFSHFMSAHAFELDVIYVTLPLAFIISLPRWTGRLRVWADNHLAPYAIYRSYHAALFLRTLGSQLVVTPKMADALDALRNHSNAWLRYYISQMQDRLPYYRTNTVMALDVGLLDAKTIDSLALISQKGESETAINARAKKATKGAIKSIQGSIGVIKLAAQLILGITLAWVTLSLMTQTIKQQVKMSQNPSMMVNAQSGPKSSPTHP